MGETQTSKWKQIKARVLDTPERQEENERKLQASIAIRQMLIEIDEERERSGLTKADLARRMGATPSSVRRVFSARAANPTLRTVVEMASVLGLRLEMKPAEKSRRRSNSTRKGKTGTLGSKAV